MCCSRGPLTGPYGGEMLSFAHCCLTYVTTEYRPYATPLR
jgi:hypothetical protein